MSVIREAVEDFRKIFEEGKIATPPGSRYRTSLEVVGVEGVSFSPEASERSLRGVMKQCYRNAGDLALFSGRGRFLYCEGFAVVSGTIPLPVPHAWVYDLKEEKALEVTWKTPGSEYLGIPFSTEWFGAWTQVRGVWGVLDSRVFLSSDCDPEKYTAQTFFKKSPPAPLLIVTDNL